MIYILQIGLRVILLALVCIYAIFVALRRAKGEKLLVWHSSSWREVKRNFGKILVFSTVLLLLIYFDLFGWQPILEFIALDVVLLAAVSTFFVLPRRYVITDLGVLIDGAFKRWKHLAWYKVKEDYIVFKEKYVLSTLKLPVEDSNKVESILRGHLKRR